MVKIAICVFLMLIGLQSAFAQSAKSQRALGALGDSLSEWADRQAKLNAKAELARAKARSESSGAPSTPGEIQQSRIEQEEVKLRQRHPEWVGHPQVQRLQQLAAHTSC